MLPIVVLALSVYLTSYADARLNLPATRALQDISWMSQRKTFDACLLIKATAQTSQVRGVFSVQTIIRLCQNRTLRRTAAVLPSSITAGMHARYGDWQPDRQPEKSTLDFQPT